ncbi:MAG: hypothetical protein ABIO70_37175 [Pseudomonadota bacterium]
MPRRDALSLLLAWSAAVTVQVAAAAATTLGIHEREELYNAAHAWLVHMGGLAQALPFQYQWFCGGCTADAVLGAGWFGLFDPSVFAWRLVGVTWFALALTAAMAAAWLASGRAGALAAALLFALAPPAYQELALICNGNHPEGGALLMLQVVLAALALRTPRPLVREAALALLALCVGFGLYFLRSLVMGLPLLALALALAAGTWRARLTRLLLAAATFALGASPLLAIRAIIGTWPLEPVYQAEEWHLSLSVAPHNLASLLLPVQIRGIWGDVQGPLQGWEGLVALAAWLGLAAGLAVALLRARPSPRAAWPAMGTLVVFVALYAGFRLSVWMDGATAPLPQQVRYLGVIAPLALAVAATAVGLAWAHPRWRRPAVAALVLLTVPGLGARARVLLQFPWAPSALRLAPDFPFLAQRGTGDLPALARAAGATPWPLVPFTGGLVQGDPHKVVAAQQDPAAEAAFQRPAPGTGEESAWIRGLVAGVALAAWDATDGDPAAWLPQVSAGVAPETPSQILLESAWSHARAALLGARDPAIARAWAAREGAWNEPAAATLLAAARGAQASTSCLLPELQAPGRHGLTWGPGCETWLPGLPAWPAGWGMGVYLAELQGPDLHAVALRAPDTDLTGLRAGFEAGWRFGAARYWLAGAAPTPAIEP